MVAGGVLGTVLFKRRLVVRELSLAKRKRLLALAHATVARGCSRLESLLCLETRLEVHPVLGRVAECLLC